MTEVDRTYDLTVEDDVLLSATETDASRLSLLVRRVVSWADALEQRHLPGRDEVLAFFRDELSKEGTLGR
jgi:hypothetical protein